MASGLLLLLDDIATILDDVALMSKMAAKKTAGVLGDDLALNAQQVTGVRADRELPIVWKVAKGSLVNKLILVPLALLISVIAPWLINPLLMLGGLFLCYEGVEKVLHTIMHKKASTSEEAEKEFNNEELDLEAFEKEKVKENFKASVEKFKSLGHTITDISLPHIGLSLAVYYILMPAEVSSNLARFDRVKYGLHVDGKDLLEDYLSLLTSSLLFYPSIEKVYS